MNLSFADKLPAEWLGLSRVFMALGHEQRQKILLMFEPGEQLQLLEIVQASGLSRTAVMHHLRQLTDAGILQRQRKGKEVSYSLDTARLLEALARVDAYVRGYYGEDKK